MSPWDKVMLVLMVIGAVGFYGGIVVLALGMFFGLRFTRGLDKKCDEP